MPNMANITVKDAANADVVLVSKTPSAGDRSQAVWTADARSTIIGFRPQLTTVTRSNGAGNARIMEVSYRGPVLETVAGVTTKRAQLGLQVSVVIPTNVSAADVYDHYVIATNALVSTLLRQVAETGYAPT